MKNLIYSSVLPVGAAAANAGTMGNDDMINDGAYIGVGGSYNSIRSNYYSFARIVSTVRVQTILQESVVSSGDSSPYNTTTTTFAPQAQAGYLKNYTGSLPLLGINMLGIKYSYQFLGQRTSSLHEDFPVQGLKTITSTGRVDDIYGMNHNGEVQFTTNHQMNLLAIVGKSFDANKYLYFGLGPAWFNIQATSYHNYMTTKAENFDLNATDSFNYRTPSIWAIGGAAQIGMGYFFDKSRTWFFDASYTYGMSANYKTFANNSFDSYSTINNNTYNTTGNVNSRTGINVRTQSVSLTVNKLFA